MFFIMTVNTSEDEDFITVLYSKYEKMMFRIAYNILRNDTDAEDAVHDAFYNIIIRDGYSKLKRLKDTEIKAYLIVTVKNASKCIYDKRRDKSAENIDDFYSIEGDPSAEEIMLSRYKTEELLNAIHKLAPDDYELLYLSVVMGLSGKELSDRLGAGTGAVRQRIYKAKKRLKTILEKEDIWRGS